jgi:predicted RNA-binding protein YlqC (UPF0109 family)
MEKDLVNYIVRALVNNPDAVKVTECVGESGNSALQLEVASEDLGRAIGRNGRTAKAIRLLLAALSNSRGQYVSLNIAD